tara:strand:+ start:121 stop:306 length:186 start_codon:yes stop_codon:yes gene_type:complete
MSYFAKNNYTKYDEWFDENISPLDLKFYYEENDSQVLCMKNFIYCQLQKYLLVVLKKIINI